MVKEIRLENFSDLSKVIEEVRVQSTERNDYYYERVYLIGIDTIKKFEDTIKRATLACEVIYNGECEYAETIVNGETLNIMVEVVKQGYLHWESKAYFQIPNFLRKI